jgi:Family of unknown function (DUF6504)/GLTT repeat (6 copies)
LPQERPGGERTTQYGEPVNVQARDDGRPVRFVRRGRLYTVHAILEHWIVNREWWQDPDPSRPSRPPGLEPAHPDPEHPEPGLPEPGLPEPGLPEPGVHEPGVHEPGVHEPGVHEPGVHEPGVHEPGVPEPGVHEPVQPQPGLPELEFWRVEASPGQGMAARVYELRRDDATDAWTLRLGAP